ncbi:hypothetical protein [Pararhizobium mangrovi]|uniref:Uncharacterized protein n=1 Tax=Pararhizobium mangrovi TaxID=2590452 RepID=A0A506U3E8_9HYPH|nr:hypothetical protein [Pararhizobium mangrovi]TPW27978.1 hypothetical protein FJU11_10575 [Pararhizobium mangrovi]
MNQSGFSVRLPHCDHLAGESLGRFFEEEDFMTIETERDTRIPTPGPELGIAGTIFFALATIVFLGGGLFAAASMFF